MKVNDKKFNLKDEYDFSNGIQGRFYSTTKISASIQIDKDIIQYFKKKASEEKIDYETLINSALKEFIHNHK